MQLDDLKNIWEKEVAMEHKITEFNEIRRRADKFDRRINFAWIIELIACAGIIAGIILRWLVWPPSEVLNPLLQLGFLVTIVAVAFVAIKIVLSRKVIAHNDWTLSSKINIQIEKREKDMKLLSTLASWYLTPLFIAVILGSYGGYVQRTSVYVPDIGLWIYWAVCVALYIGIYFLNQHRVKTKIQPILEQLYAVKRELES